MGTGLVCAPRFFYPSIDRIDNQLTCYTAIQGLIAATGQGELVDESDDEENVRCVALFDNVSWFVLPPSKRGYPKKRIINLRVKLKRSNSKRYIQQEEIGSVSYQGAESDLIPSFVRRMTAAGVFGNKDISQVLKDSFLISSDCGHAVCGFLLRPSQPAPRLQPYIQLYLSRSPDSYWTISSYSGIPCPAFVLILPINLDQPQLWIPLRSQSRSKT